MSKEVIFHHFLLLSLFSFLNFTGYCQSNILDEKVYLQYQGVPLAAVLDDLDSSYNFNFSYFDDIPMDKVVSLDIQGEPLGNALQQLFEKADLNYAIQGNQVVLKRMMKDIFLSGKIIDKTTGEPLPLTSVSIKGKKVGIVSNPDGEFGIMIPSRFLNDTLYVSRVGYDNYEIDLSQLNSHGKMHIALENKPQMLSEVVILGDQDQWKKLATSQAKKDKEATNVIFKKFVAHAHLSLDAAFLDKINIHCGTGFLKIMPNETGKNTIEVDAEIITASISEQENQKFLDRFLDLSMKEEKGAAFLKSVFRIQKYKKNGSIGFPVGNALGTPGSKINLKVSVPKDLFLEIKDGSGQISIQNITNNIYVKDGSGNIQIKNVTGDIKVHDRSGELNISRITGNVDIKDSSGGIKVRKVSGSLILTDRSGQIEMNEIAMDSTHQHTVQIKDGSGKILVNNIGGETEIKDRSGGIEISDSYKDIRIEDRSGAIHINGLEGELHLKDRSGRVNSNKDPKPIK
ncbi:carboxypeptidase-like regulatory domain-containing protein [Flexithrix dorotheae]|uniref:carboxypeptidase-like regulatory domain-containing protein n=1 Tax=Flexithrix dorotheae TaxID=70993 RepID=UPI00036F183D|nr:carboxypeptidase-like regulatory domain-containing protein [Flexithrix dorotheae]